MPWSVALPTAWQVRHCPNNVAPRSVSAVPIASDSAADFWTGSGTQIRLASAVVGSARTRMLRLARHRALFNVRPRVIVVCDAVKALSFRENRTVHLKSSAVWRSCCALASAGEPSDGLPLAVRQISIPIFGSARNPKPGKHRKTATLTPGMTVLLPHNLLCVATSQRNVQLRVMTEEVLLPSCGSWRCAFSSWCRLLGRSAIRSIGSIAARWHKSQ